MNLHEFVRSAITLVNPDQSIRVLAGAGQSVGPDYIQRPVWSACAEVPAQVQPVPDKILQWLVQERRNTLWRDVYVFGPLSGLRRADESGGDLLYFEGFEWQVDQVLEGWNPTAGWTKVRVALVRACEPPDVGATMPPKATGETDA